MRIISTIIYLLFACGSLTAQESPPRYNLKVGDRYFLEQKLSQSTRTEDGNLVGNVSLDISNTLELEVDSVTPDGSYLLRCNYTSLKLDFFAPQSDIAISSSNSAFIPIKSYLTNLEGTTFSALMSATGAFLEVRGLDSAIHQLNPPGALQPQKKEHAEKVKAKGQRISPEPAEKEHSGIDRQRTEQNEKGRERLIKKTIQDAFGAAALRNAASIALNFYDDTSTFRCVKESEVLFNGRPVKISNNLYYTTLDQNARRVQGVGVIAESTTTIELNDYLLVTSLKGSQTYDFLCALPSGWVLEGMSKQKIQSLSGVRNHEELPDGLKIPSITESEYRFRGGKLN